MTVDFWAAWKVETITAECPTHGTDRMAITAEQLVNMTDEERRQWALIASGQIVGYAFRGKGQEQIGGSDGT